MRTLTLEQYHSELKAQGVQNNELAMKCPACGTIQNANDLIKAEAGKDFDEVEKYLGFSCVGRFTRAGDAGITAKNKGQKWDRGCNWTLGGLLRIHELEVVTPDGNKFPRFEPCSPEEAQSHLSNPTRNAMEGNK